MTKPINVTAATFETEVLGADLPVLVDFWAPWCGPCRQLGPVLEDLSGEFDGQIKVAKVNTQEERALAGAFQVQSIPHLVVLYKGMVIGSFSGYAGPAATKELFDNIVEVKGQLDGDDEFQQKVEEVAAQRAAEAAGAEA